MVMDWSCSCIFFAHMESRITVPKKKYNTACWLLISSADSIPPKLADTLNLPLSKNPTPYPKQLPSDRRGRIATTSYSLLPLAGSMSWGWAKRPWALVPWASRGPPCTVCLHLKKHVSCTLFSSWFFSPDFKGTCRKSIHDIGLNDTGWERHSFTHMSCTELDRTSNHAVPKRRRWEANSHTHWIHGIGIGFYI